MYRNDASWKITTWAFFGVNFEHFEVSLSLSAMAACRSLLLLSTSHNKIFQISLTIPQICAIPQYLSLFLNISLSLFLPHSLPISHYSTISLSPSISFSQCFTILLRYSLFRTILTVTTPYCFSYAIGKLLYD